jgi:DNA-binding NarL/FixJ family response regulator
LLGASATATVTTVTAPDGPPDDTGRIRVVVHAQDPISREGARGHLRRFPRIDLRDEDASGPGTVVLLVENAFDEAALTRLRRLTRGEGARVVLIVGSLRESDLLDVVECGVGVIVWRHEATATRLARAVTSAASGAGDLPPDLLGQLLGRVGALRRGTAVRGGSALPGLTAREADVLRLVAEGLDTGEIAGKLCYSERTVKNVLHDLTTRLRLRNRAHAVAHALREGYI